MYDAQLYDVGVVVVVLAHPGKEKLPTLPLRYMGKLLNGQSRWQRMNMAGAKQGTKRPPLLPHPPPIVVRYHCRNRSAAVAALLNLVLLNHPPA